MTEDLARANATRRELLKRGVALGVTVPLAGAIAGCDLGGGSSSSSSAERPRRGGALRVGLTGGSTSDNLDGNNPIGYPAAARVAQLYDGLITLAGVASLPGGPSGEPEYALATEITPNRDATAWTIGLRSGVTFHDGKPLTADDLIFTFRRILNPKFPLPGATALGPVDVKNLKKLDKLTVRVPMTTPFASFLDQLSNYVYLYIVPVGYDPAKPVGTGPFKFASNKPGVQSKFVRNDDYWQPSLPYVDSITTINFADVTSMVNALVSGQIDAAANIDGTSAKALASKSNVKVVLSKSGLITPFTMRVDVPPFNDVRVRQAMRSVVDRPQLIETALGGFATVGNDVFSPYDPCYDDSLKRSQDLEQAKFLLKQAGREDLSVELVTAEIATGTVAGATAFQQMAAQAGINVKLRKVDAGVFFGPQYLSWPFAQDWYQSAPYLSQVATELLPKAPFNETHWNNPKYTALYAQANSIVDSDSRCEVVREMMQIDFEEGGLIVPSYNSINDSYTTRISGTQTSTVGYPFGNFQFGKLWFNS